MNPHWKFFTQFARAELNVGGPDAQLALIARYVAERSRMQQAWMAGIYCAHHTAASAYAVFEAFPFPHHVMGRERKTLRAWLKRHWDNLPLRREMRSHRMLDKRVACLESFAAYAIHDGWRHGDYDDVWRSSIDEVRFYGRYMALKYLELLRLTARPELRLHDLRAKHAWSPRIALAMLYPKHEHVLLDRKDNRPWTILLVESLAKKLMHDLRFYHDIRPNYFQLQVLLCNYKQTTLGRFYPGMGLDEELEYMRQARVVRSMQPLCNLRKIMYDPDHLGEIGGWKGIRPSELQRWKTKGARLA